MKKLLFLVSFPIFLSAEKKVLLEVGLLNYEYTDNLDSAGPGQPYEPLSCDDISLDPEVLENVETIKNGKDCTNCKLAGSCLQKVNLNGKYDLSDWSGAFIKDSNLDGSSHQNSLFKGVKLINCSLRNTKFNNSNMVKLFAPNADFTAADLTNVDIKSSKIQRAKFDYADLSYADFSGARLDNSSFKNIKMNPVTNFTYAILRYVDFLDATGKMVVAFGEFFPTVFCGIRMYDGTFLFDETDNCQQDEIDSFKKYLTGLGIDTKKYSSVVNWNNNLIAPKEINFPEPQAQ